MPWSFPDHQHNSERSQAMHRHLSSVSARLRANALAQRRQETKFTRRLYSGDATAWIQLLNRWSPRLYSYVSYNVDDEAETRNLIRLILTDVIHFVIRRPQLPNLTVLIFTIAYRHVLHYRRQTPASALFKPQPPTSTTEDAATQGAQFLEGFRQFSPEVQQILLLRYLCGITLPELSQITGQPEERLTSTIHRAERYLL